MNLLGLLLFIILLVLIFSLAKGAISLLVFSPLGLIVLVLLIVLLMNNRGV